MNIRTEHLSIETLASLLDSKIAINSHTEVENYTVEKWFAGIPQQIIYAIDDSNAKTIIIQANSIVKPLVDLYKSENKLTVMQKRRLGYSTIQFCYLYLDKTSDATVDEVVNFMNLTTK